MMLGMRRGSQENLESAMEERHVRDDIYQPRHNFSAIRVLAGPAPNGVGVPADYQFARDGATCTLMALCR